MATNAAHFSRARVQNYSSPISYRALQHKNACGKLLQRSARVKINGYDTTVREDATGFHSFAWFSWYLFGFESPEGDLKSNIAMGGSAPHTSLPMFVFKSHGGDLKANKFCGGAPPPTHPQYVGLWPPAFSDMYWASSNI